MSNRTDPNRWAARERLSYLETLIFWRGWIRRADIMSKFRISEPHASADIAAYLKLNPRSLRYNKSTKRYEALPDMKPKLIEPRFGDAIASLNSGDLLPVERVGRIDLPTRVESVESVRPIVRALLSGEAIEIRYFSINSGTAEWRWIYPGAFAHDGYRWHIRAWCEQSRAHKDFVFGRIESTRKTKSVGSPPPDPDWDTFTTIRFRAHSALSPTQRMALERDFGMTKGVGTLRVRQAMLFYTLLYLGLKSDRHPFAKRLELL